MTAEMGAEMAAEIGAEMGAEMRAVARLPRSSHLPPQVNPLGGAAGPRVSFGAESSEEWPLK